MIRLLHVNLFSFEGKTAWVGGRRSMCGCLPCFAGDQIECGDRAASAGLNAYCNSSCLGLAPATAMAFGSLQGGLAPCEDRIVECVKGWREGVVKGWREGVTYGLNPGDLVDLGAKDGELRGRGEVQAPVTGESCVCRR
jgi:hypothetical protein